MRRVETWAGLRREVRDLLDHYSRVHAAVEDVLRAAELEDGGALFTALRVYAGIERPPPFRVPNEMLGGYQN